MDRKIYVYFLIYRLFYYLVDLIKPLRLIITGSIGIIARSLAKCTFSKSVNMTQNVQKLSIFASVRFFIDTALMVPDLNTRPKNPLV